MYLLFCTRWPLPPSSAHRKLIYTWQPNYNFSFLPAGDLEDEDEVLAWITDEDTLEIPGRIEEVNARMLDRILNENDHVVVFFCKLSFEILN